MVQQFPCVRCSKCVKANQKALLCTSCHNWVHISCSGISAERYDDPNEHFISWECSKCLLKHLPNYVHVDNKSGSSVDDSSNEYPRSKLGDNISLKYDQLAGKGIKFVHLNIVSLLKYHEEIKQIIVDNDIHVLALNETRLDSSIADSEISIPHYSLLRKDRDRFGGGVAIYVHESIHFNLVTHNSLEHLEALCINVCLKNSKPIIFLNWYRPPNSKVELFNYYEDFLVFANSLNGPLIVMGDTNCDIMKKPFVGNTKVYNEINDIYCLKQVNDKLYTRVTDRTCTLVDHMLTDHPEMVKSFGVIENGVSDHYTSYLVWKCKHTFQGETFISFRKSRNVDLEAFKSDLRNQNWKKIEEFCDINDAVSVWEKMLLEVVNRHMPMKTRRVRKKPSPWMNSEILSLMKQRDKAKLKAKKRNSDDFWKIYKRMKNKVTTEIRKSKRKYICDRLSEVTNRNESWRTLKSLIGNNCNSSNNIFPKENSSAIANEFNNHFANISTNVCTNNKRVNNRLNSHGVNVSDSKFKFLNVSQSYVLKQVMSMKTKKSVGLDGISMYILKESILEMIEPFTFLINKSLSEGIVPDNWKVAKVIPIHKKGDKLDYNNYRPISLLPCASKVMERVVQRQLLDYIKSQSLLSQNQSGFRPKHSTVTALASVTDDWFHSIDKGNYIGTIFVDLQKAFDMVDHLILISKLESLGVTGVELKWFKNYLSNRRIRTSVNNVLSDEKLITKGVPQGSLLGPLLFIIFINDINSAFSACKVHLYADDTVIYYSHKNLKEVENVLNKELNSLEAWMNNNNLKINYDKTVCMLLGTHNMLKKQALLNIKINEQQLSQVKSFKYLGVHVDEKLKWDVHIEQTRNKLSKMVNYLGRLRQFVNMSELKLIYNSIILPHFDYGDVVWQSASSKSLTQLQKIQNRAGRIILKVNPYSHTSTSQIHSCLGWKMIRERQTSHLILLTYKILNNMTPAYLKDMFKFKPSPYSLRNEHNLFLPKPTTNYCKRSFVYRASLQYNKLSPDLRKLPTFAIFKNNLHKL